jgi:hypothetical protein
VQRPSSPDIHDAKSENFVIHFLDIVSGKGDLNSRFLMPFPNPLATSEAVRLLQSSA